jgi:hypothetical protein
MHPALAHRPDVMPLHPSLIRTSLSLLVLVHALSLRFEHGLMLDGFWDRDPLPLLSRYDWSCDLFLRPFGFLNGVMPVDVVTQNSFLSSILT